MKPFKMKTIQDITNFLKSKYQITANKEHNLFHHEITLSDSPNSDSPKLVISFHSMTSEYNYIVDTETKFLLKIENPRERIHSSEIIAMFLKEKIKLTTQNILFKKNEVELSFHKYINDAGLLAKIIDLSFKLIKT